MKFLPFLLFLFFVSTVHAQQFAHYNTGTLFNSFENPAQQAFIPDSSRQFAANFLLPNFSGTGSVTGNGRQSLKSLIQKGVYNSNKLTNGFQNQNNLNVGLNTYWLMLKLYTRLDGDREFGLSVQTKAEGNGNMTDETLLLLDSYKNFDNGTLNQDLFNNQLEGQAYHQLSLSYRQKLSSAIAFGIKLSTLLGIYYNRLDIQHSSFSVDKNSTQSTLFLQGSYLSSYADKFEKKDLLGIKNPGAAISLGLQAKLGNGILVQGNLKDLGLIRWSTNSVTYDFNNSEDIDRIATVKKNDSRILTEVDSITSHNGSRHAFYTPINGKTEVAISKKFSFFTPDFYYTPTVVASKNLFNNGLTAALVNHFTYKSLWFTALAAYNNQNRVWNAGVQLMFKSPNAEFYIGTEQLFESANFFNTDNSTSKSAGINAFLGFSLKFGKLIEHPANASHVPMGEGKGFFNKLWRHIFKSSSY